MIVLTILYFSGQIYHHQFTDMQSCRAVLLESVDNGNYKNMAKAICEDITIEEL